MTAPTLAEAFAAGREDAQLEAEIKRLKRLIADAAERGSTGPSSMVSLFEERLGDLLAERAALRSRFGVDK